MNGGSLIAHIKAALPLEAVLSDAGIHLERGKRRCPFHDDRSPSFTSRGEKWRCWACGEGGDVLDFVKKFHGLDTRGAIKMLADRAGISTHRTPADTRAAVQARQERGEREKTYRAWEKHKVDSMAALLWLYRQKEAQGFAEDELKVFAPLIHAMPEIEYTYETVFCTRDDTARRALFEEEYHNAG